MVFTLDLANVCAKVIAMAVKQKKIVVHSRTPDTRGPARYQSVESEMRKLIYSMMVSLDGFIEGPNRELDWHIVDEELHTYINDQQSAIGAYLYGRRMYENMADYWPTADTDPSIPGYILEFARIWKKMPKIVFSKTLEGVEGNATLVREVSAEEVRELKQQPGKDLAVGGAGLATTFMRLGLIDEYGLFVHPVILGRGTPLFPVPANTVNLRLIEARTFGSGVVYLRYQRADEE
jgi:dihydrofolate reductase